MLSSISVHECRHFKVLNTQACLAGSYLPDTLAVGVVASLVVLAPYRNKRRSPASKVPLPSLLSSIPPASSSLVYSAVGGSDLARPPAPVPSREARALLCTVLPPAVSGH